MVRSFLPIRHGKLIPSLESTVYKRNCSTWFSKYTIYWPCSHQGEIKTNHWLLCGWYTLRQIVYNQQRYRPSDNNTNLDIKFSAHDAFLHQRPPWASVFSLIHTHNIFRHCNVQSSCIIAPILYWQYIIMSCYLLFCKMGQHFLHEDTSCN